MLSFFATLTPWSPEPLLVEWSQTRQCDDGNLDELPKIPESLRAHSTLGDIFCVLCAPKLLKDWGWSSGVPKFSHITWTKASMWRITPCLHTFNFQFFKPYVSSRKDCNQIKCFPLFSHTLFFTHPNSLWNTVPSKHYNKHLGLEFVSQTLINYGGKQTHGCSDYTVPLPHIPIQWARNKNII